MTIIKKVRYVLLFLTAIILCIACNNDKSKSENKTQSHQKDSIIENRSINSYNWYLPPYKYLAFKNMKVVFATNSISSGNLKHAFEKNLISFDSLKIKQRNGQTLSFQQHLDTSRTDALLVLHKGKIVTEEYLGNMKENSYHNWFSISKSLIGLVIGILAHENKVDLQQNIAHYLPELKESIWRDASVQTVLDMLTSIQFNEDYNDPNSDLYTFGRVTRFIEIPTLEPPFNSVSAYLKTIQKEKSLQHDSIFHYVSLNTEVLGMLINKVTGKLPSVVISEKIWDKIGTANDAYIVKDSTNHELVSASINSTIRDAGLLGQLLLDGGIYKGDTIIPQVFIKAIQKGGNTIKFNPSKQGQEFKNFSYKNQWWHTDNDGFFAKGLFGQWLFIQSDIQTVIVKFSTTDIPSDHWGNDYQLIKEICKKIK